MQNKNKMVSIIVPVYNVEKFLPKCIDYLIGQTYKNIEILLIDDGSTDLSGMICDKYKDQDERIKVVHKVNSGLADTRNEGIKYSTGDFIMFVDSDDYIEKSTVEKCVNKMDDDVDVVVFGMYIDYSDGTSISKKINGKNKLSNLEALIELNSFKNIDVSACNKLYRKNIFDNIKFPKGKLCEDYYVMYKIFDNSRYVIKLSECLYHYYQRVNSITRSKKFNMDFIYASEFQYKYLSQKYPELINVWKTNYIYSYITYYNYNLVNNINEIQANNNIINIIYDNKKAVYMNKYIHLKKKIQILIFIVNRKMYDFIIYRKYR